MIRLTIGIPVGAALTINPREKKRALRAAGNQVARLTRRKLALAGTGAKRGSHVASAPGQPPAKLTGALARSIGVKVFRSGDGVAIRARRFYALFLEAGARGGIGSGKAGVKGKRNTRRAVVGTREVEPRPFLSAAMDELSGDALGERLRDAIVRGIEFRQGRQKVSRLRDRR
jgi:hypothetical protein